MARDGKPVLTIESDTPLLVFGGPYSNLRATEALIVEARRRGIPPDHVICTGDVVAYCAEPEQTARVIKEWGCHVIQGNCEEQLAAGAADCGCNFEEGTACDLLAKGWYPFAASRVTGELCAWMGGLPRRLDFRYGGASLRVLHGGNSEIARWVFRSDEHRIEREIEEAGTDVVIAGHCGLPFVVRSQRGTWFNPGVIGMPANDGTADVWYGLVKASGSELELSTHRLTYDHAGAAAALRRLGHANEYARTLLSGVWPSFDVLPEEERGSTGVRLAPVKARLKVGGGEAIVTKSQIKATV